MHLIEPEVAYDMLKILPKFAFLFDAISGKDPGHTMVIGGDSYIHGLIESVWHERVNPHYRYFNLTKSTILKDLTGMVMNLSEKDLIIYQGQTIELRQDCYQLLKRALEQNSIIISIGKGTMASTLSLSLPKFTFLALLEQPMKAEASLEPCFDNVVMLDDADVAAITTMCLKQLFAHTEYTASPAVLSYLAEVSNLNCRSALRNAQRIVDYLKFGHQFGDGNEINKSIVDTVLNTIGARRTVYQYVCPKCKTQVSANRATNISCMNCCTQFNPVGL